MSNNYPAPKPFNPLDKKHLGESVAEAMLEGPVHALPPEPFIGAGIYAIYYIGDFDPSTQMAESPPTDQLQWPLYVGTAVPPGARKEGFGLGADPGTALFKRLSEHYESVSAAQNLNQNDFYCRYLVVDDIWIPLAESLLIERFQPVWNRVLDGFGNHDPGKGRYEQQRSPWDEVHPGRVWAEKLNPAAFPADVLSERVVEFLLAQSVS